MSRAEEITSEVRRLVMTCRSLEAQLQQSVPKKTHQEMVTKMQAAIDNLSADLGRTKKSLEETETLGGRLNVLTNQITAQNEIISSQIKTIESLTSKMTETTVPIKMYSELVSNFQSLQTQTQGMVPKSDFDALQSRISELESQISSCVPRTQYASLELEISNSVPKQRFEELETQISKMVSKDEYDAASTRAVGLENQISQMVSREDYGTAMSRIVELEASLASSVPKSSYEDLQQNLEHANSLIDAHKMKESELENTITNSVPKSSFDELQASFALTIPKAEFEAASQRIAELESTVANSVSRASFLELQGQLDQSRTENTAATEKIRGLEDSLSNSVPKAKFDEVSACLANSVPREQLDSANSRIAELEGVVASSVPKSQFEELQSQMSSMVTGERHTQVLSRVSELEQALANSVPRSDFEDMTSKITSLTRELVANFHMDIPNSRSESHEETNPAAIAEVQPIQTAQPEVPDTKVEIETPAVASAAEPLPTESPVIAESVPNEIVAPVESAAAQPPAPIEQSADISAPSPEVESHVESVAIADVPPTIQEVVAETPVIEPVTESAATVEAPTSQIEVTVEDAKVSSQEPVQTLLEHDTTNTTIEVAPQPEVREVQSQLSEIKGAQEAGEQTTLPIQESSVDQTKGFRFSNTGFCAMSGLEFLEDVEKVDVQILQQHSQSGDFERWFKDVLSDEISAESLRTIRESNYAGEELRTKVAAIISSKYRN